MCINHAWLEAFAACAGNYPPRFARCEALLGGKERLPRLIIEAAKGGIRDVRYWPKADISSCTANVRFRGQSGHSRDFPQDTNHIVLERVGALDSDRRSSPSFSVALGANGGEPSAPVIAMICC
jgi:hypothetical protein